MSILLECPSYRVDCTQIVEKGTVTEILAMPCQTVWITLVGEKAHMCDFGESSAADSLCVGGFAQMSLLAG